jgi:hypothetical protein
VREFVVHTWVDVLCKHIWWSVWIAGFHLLRQEYLLSWLNLLQKRDVRLTWVGML